MSSPSASEPLRSGNDSKNDEYGEFVEKYGSYAAGHHLRFGGWPSGTIYRDHGREPIAAAKSGEDRAVRSRWSLPPFDNQSGRDENDRLGDGRQRPLRSITAPVRDRTRSDMRSRRFPTADSAVNNPPDGRIPSRRYDLTGSKRCPTSETPGLGDKIDRSEVGLLGPVRGEESPRRSGWPSERTEAM